MSWINTRDLLYYFHFHVPRFPKKMLWVMGHTEAYKRVITNIYIYIKGVIPLTGIIPPHFCVCPKPVKERGKCSLWWFKSNCWPPLFTLFKFRNFAFLIPVRIYIYFVWQVVFKISRFYSITLRHRYMFYMRSTYKTNFT